MHEELDNGLGGGRLEGVVSRLSPSDLLTCDLDVCTTNLGLELKDLADAREVIALSCVGLLRAELLTSSFTLHRSFLHLSIAFINPSLYGTSPRWGDVHEILVALEAEIVVSEASSTRCP